uniref:interferon gamma-like isoform X2 n=1 Tax=Scatophagus argus TaxID=75038 RepID=UPI001ED865AD|nr:interferon gamma-like isoform X2 [Scatophagus argus]
MTFVFHCRWVAFPFKAYSSLSLTPVWGNHRDFPLHEKAFSSTRLAKMFFMGGILDTYEKLLGRMLKQLPTPGPQTAGRNSVVTPAPGTASNPERAAGGDIRTQLNYILKKVRELKERRYKEQEKVLQGLQSLRHIQMDNFIIQSKALWDLPWFYEEASSLPENIEKMQRRRRRRQAQRFKSHARV